ncbi:MAG: sigma 54-interacting transcriptional regulator [Myxococcaceae bacterium]|nr:sigma 54-interacting transcriptional regulator [Myxococcaceae bacterium]
MATTSGAGTELIPTVAQIAVQAFELKVQPKAGAPSTWRSTGATCAIGSHPSNDLVLEAPQVSRFHCELRLTPRGLLLKDLGSSNGTLLDGVSVIEAWVRPGSRLVIGSVTLEVQLIGRENTIATSERETFGALAGSSAAMRSIFAQLERAAASDITVLIQGETGTGKEETAAALHAHSARAAKPFVVIDCSALPATLLESELFGHERGAFTGAHATRAGAFEEADGGTVFLDEVGELPLELQPKLLRVLEAREFRPLGAQAPRTTDVRVIAATNRDLRKEINEGRFRADLYFRIAVLRVTMPPLRTHPEDLPIIARKLLQGLAAQPAQIEALLTPAFLSSLRAATWPGNVRELRNHLERCLLFSAGLPLEEAAPPAAPPSSVDARRPLEVERRRHVEAFEREYVRALLEAHSGNVNAAAQAAGVDRAYLYRLIKKLSLKPQ